MADINAIGKQFVDFYYQTFDSGRTGLQPLYRENSMLTWEGTQIMGATAIMEKLVSLPFQTVQHRVDTTDAQPASLQISSMIVHVTGLLIVDDSPNPLHFSQTFQLMPDPSGYYVQNDIFRLNYG